MFFAPVYSASKFAVVAFVRSLAVSFSPSRRHDNFNRNVSDERSKGFNMYIYYGLY